MVQPQQLSALKIKNIIKYISQEDITFWLINIYVFFEYVRPHHIYAWGGFPFTQTVIILATLSLFFKGRAFSVSNILNIYFILFFLIIILSSFFAIDPQTSFSNISTFIAWILIYFLIINIINTETRFFIFILAFLLYNFKMAQFAFRGWLSIGFQFGKEGTGGGPGWFRNSGEFGVEMCIFASLAIYFFLALKKDWTNIKKYLFLTFPFLAISGIISSASRGALLGLSSVLLWMVFKSSKKIMALACMIVIVIISFSFIPPEQLTRLQEMGSDQTSIGRIMRWERGLKLAEMYPFLGVGYKNWSIADKIYFDGNGVESHNIFIECVSELGYTGLIVFIILIFYNFKNNYQTRKVINSMTNDNKFIYYMAHALDAALVGYMVSGFFVTILYYPYFWINMSMTVALNNIAKKRKFKMTCLI